MNKEEVIKILEKHEMHYSSQLIEFAVRFNSADLLESFCVFWKQKPAGGGDFTDYFVKNYNKKLGDEKC
jgi:hypothetical protein